MGFDISRAKQVNYGEIPSKGKLTAHQKSQLEKNRPDFDPDWEAKAEEAMENWTYGFDDADYDQDIIALLDRAKEANVGLGDQVIEEEFLMNLEDVMISNGMLVNLDEAVLVAQKRELRPYNFYFNITPKTSLGRVLLVSAAKTWDKNKSRSENNLESWFVQELDVREVDGEPGTYYVDVNRFKEIEYKMKKMGFEHNHLLTRSVDVK